MAIPRRPIFPYPPLGKKEKMQKQYDREDIKDLITALKDEVTCEQFGFDFMEQLIRDSRFAFAWCLLSSLVLPLNDQSPLSHYRMFAIYASCPSMIIPEQDLDLIQIRNSLFQFLKADFDDIALLSNIIANINLLVDGDKPYWIIEYPLSNLSDKVCQKIYSRLDDEKKKQLLIKSLKTKSQAHEKTIESLKGNLFLFKNPISIRSLVVRAFTSRDIEFFRNGASYLWTLNISKLLIGLLSKNLRLKADYKSEMTFFIVVYKLVLFRFDKSSLMKRNERPSLGICGTFLEDCILHDDAEFLAIIDGWSLKDCGSYQYFYQKCGPFRFKLEELMQMLKFAKKEGKAECFEFLKTALNSNIINLKAYRDKGQQMSDIIERIQSELTAIESEPFEPKEQIPTKKPSQQFLLDKRDIITIAWISAAILMLSIIMRIFN